VPIIVTNSSPHFHCDEMVLNRRTWRKASNRKIGCLKVDDVDVYEVNGSGGDKCEWRKNGRR
jgi:hypothetical protein